MRSLIRILWEKVLAYPFALLMIVISMMIPFNWLMQRTMKNEARRLAKECASLYSEYKQKDPNASETEVIKNAVFDKEKLASIPEISRKRLEICSETVNGFCYMMALDLGKLKRLMNFRSLQFTYYMDRELEAQGFSLQSKEQKERILEAMGLPMG